MATRPALAPKHGANCEMNGKSPVEYIATLRGQYHFCEVRLAYTTPSYSAEINQLKKLQATKLKENESEGIPRPIKITSLQDAMGLTENKKLYSYC